MKNEIELNDELRKLDLLVRSAPPEKVAYAIIKLFMGSENPTEETKEKFWRWLISPGNAEAKDMALGRCFSEILETGRIKPLKRERAKH